MPPPPRRLTLLVALMIVPLLLMAGGYHLAQASKNTPTTAIADALTQTRAAGSYHLTANVQQTIAGFIAARLRDASSSSTMLRVEGEVVQTPGATDALPNA